MNRIFGEDLIQRQKLHKKIREDVKFINKSLSQIIKGKQIWECSPE